jgi:hypothetical protein
MGKRITIPLTDRRPVSISEDEWPLIVRVSGDSCEIRDPARHDQAVEQGQADTYEMEVRQHADGRALIYGRYDEAQWSESDHPGPSHSGRLVAPGGDVAQEIRHVGSMLYLPETLIADCIAGLTPEDL